MNYFGHTFFRPPEDYELGIRGGPILPNGIYNDSAIDEALDYEADRYALLYSPVTPTGQKMALVIAMAGLLGEISVISTNNGRLLSRSHNGTHELSWGSVSRAEGAAFEIGSMVRSPVLVDLKTRKVISNDPYLLPVKLLHDVAMRTGRDSIMSLLEGFDGQVDLESRIFYDLHAGVYRSGFVTKQEEYEQEVEKVYRFLTDLNQRLSGSKYVGGNSLTLPDLWLFTMLIRYDQVYAPGFRLHKYRLRDFPEVWRYLRDLYSIPEFSFTTDFALISQGYFLGIPALNRGIVPIGPEDSFL